MNTEVVFHKPSEVYNSLKKVILSNDILIERGEIPISVSVIGERGIGKTTLCRELAQDLERDLYKLNLSQLTEPSELIGFYAKEFKLTKDKEVQWVTENLIPEYVHNKYNYSGETRTVPCPPSWVIGLKEKSILLLDDYSRSNSLFSQAIMELVNEGTMIGWNLRDKKVQVLLSENPDNGEYNVASQDGAQTDRMMRIHMKWDATNWAERAEKIKLNEKLINFVLWKPELLEQKKSEGISDSGNISPRMMDKFFSLVSTIEDFEKNLDEIVTFGEMSVGKYITSELVSFINKRLDKLPSVKKLLQELTLDRAKAELTMACGDYEKDPTNWKAASAAILSVRMYNYMKFNQKEIKKDDIKQYLELILHPSFSIDQKFIMVKQVVSCSNTFSTVLCGDPRMAEYLKA